MIRHLTALVPVGFVIAIACGSPSGAGERDGRVSSGGTSAGGSGGNGGISIGGSGNTGGTVGGGINFDASGGSAGNLQGDACGGFELQPEQITTTHEETITETEPVAIYLMMDQSGSMIGTKWTTLVNAITTFVNDPSSANLDVAIPLFPPLFPDCNAATYATPAVPLGRLPGHASAIITELNNHQPLGLGTPIEPALAGAEQFCTAFKSSTNRNPPDEDCVVVFMTDGDPTACSTDTNVIAGYAATAWQNAQVRTYAIGMDGAVFSLLDEIAKRGNTDCDPNGAAYACNATSGSAGLSAALAAIRDTISNTVTRTETVTAPLKCEWGIPPPPDGETFDPNQVNVDLLANGTKTRLGNVASEAECAGHTNGWYYDDPTNPTRILACPDTCTAVTSPGVAGVTVALGCATEVAVPK
jgi:uncharacterized protein YegL